MNRQKLVDAIAHRTGQTKVATGRQLDVMLDVILRSLAKGDPVQLVGFGRFSTRSREAREGRNPNTGKAMKIAAAKTVKFAAGKAFREAVNNIGNGQW
jgi:DNA-binding protein HU-beta